MKIGIITYQLAWNCGAVIQCYAMQEYLESLGHEAVVIDYRPKKKKYRYVKYCNPFVAAGNELKNAGTVKIRIKRSAKRFVRTILNYRSDSEHIRQYNGFSSFCRNRLHLTKEYTDLEQMRKDPPKCDVYLSGSDQLWNPRLSGWTLDPAYFLQFGTEDTERITYAVSACELDAEKYSKELKEYCANLDHISLREHEGVEAIEKVIGRHIEVCPDPTFLPELGIYEPLVPDKLLDLSDYIAVYLLMDATDDYSAIEKVRKLKEALGKPVLVLSGPRHWPFEVTQIQGILPEEFVYYIKNASCVVCNSFHATVFSVLYEKQFVTLSFKGRNARMNELLTQLDLNERTLKPTDDMVEKMREPIDYTKVNQKRTEMRSRGTEYLKKCL